MIRPHIAKLIGCLALLALPGLAAAQAFDRIVVFGTSLSDPGNAFALVGGTSTPPDYALDPFLIPDAPYTGGGGGSHHFSNGPTWIEQFARPLGLARNVRPAFKGSSGKAANYAVGGARARAEGSAHLSEQVGAFLRDSGGVAPSNALYVIEMGGNDLRDALFAGPAGAGGIITDAVTSIVENVGMLYAAGARRFLIWKAPNIGLTPAIQGAGAQAVFFAEFFTGLFNDALDQALQDHFGALNIPRLDVNATLNALIATPSAFGLSNVRSPCVTPNVPPFRCQNADEYLFWDGIHPTTGAHGIIAQAAAGALAH